MPPSTGALGPPTPAAAGGGNGALGPHELGGLRGGLGSPQEAAPAVAPATSPLAAAVSEVYSVNLSWMY